jgi:hypothetical protein
MRVKVTVDGEEKDLLVQVKKKTISTLASLNNMPITSP